ncbi:MAG: hypothetical protein LBR52_00090 [Prevotellaceae bacterium]|jgi:hypothetical protein|nr:hypothetical protein [Prevotellaceae bacterium]
MDWLPENFLRKAAEIHEDVENYIRKILEVNHYVDKSNKICSGILSLARKVGACRIAHSYGRYSFLEIQDILKTQSEFTQTQEETAAIPGRENIRGKEYYK